MTEKVLFVDDEELVLDAFKRSLRHDFDLTTASSGTEALEIIAKDGPFAVIISDMRMPVMNGIELLRRVNDASPDTIRIMLTGNGEQQTAADAVNEGNIFRFLSKPCTPQELAAAIRDGLAQYRLVVAEQQLLEETLNRSLHVLLDILAIVNPTAFSRSNRIKKLARDIADAMEVRDAWQVEFAAMLSQIGCVTVPEEILRKVAGGGTLNDREAGLYAQHPQIAYDLISQIPRLETVAEIISRQNERLRDESGSPDAATVGARILKVVLDYDRAIAKGDSPHTALRDMSERHGWYEPTVLHILHHIIEKTTGTYETFELSVADLRPGMVLAKTLASIRGSALLPEGLDITPSLILRLNNLLSSGIINDSVSVNVNVDDSGRFEKEVPIMSAEPERILSI